jgi:hypothetical protein
MKRNHPPKWKEPSKIWVGLGNPCDDMDMDLFYASTTITLGNGEKTPFWKAPWLNGLKPIDIAPSYTTSPLGKIGTLRRP